MTQIWNIHGLSLSLGIDIPEPPVIYPWGWRALGFKDPNGNYIDLVHYVVK